MPLPVIAAGIAALIGRAAVSAAAKQALTSAAAKGLTRTQVKTLITRKEAHVALKDYGHAITSTDRIGITKAINSKGMTAKEVEKFAQKQWDKGFETKPKFLPIVKAPKAPTKITPESAKRIAARSVEKRKELSTSAAKLKNEKVDVPRPPGVSRISLKQARTSAGSPYARSEAAPVGGNISARKAEVAKLDKLYSELRETDGITKLQNAINLAKKSLNKEDIAHAKAVAGKLKREKTDLATSTYNRFKNDTKIVTVKRAGDKSKKATKAARKRIREEVRGKRKAASIEGGVAKKPPSKIGPVRNPKGMPPKTDIEARNNIARAQERAAVERAENAADDAALELQGKHIRGEFYPDEVDAGLLPRTAHKRTIESREPVYPEQESRSIAEALSKLTRGERLEFMKAERQAAVGIKNQAKRSKGKVTPATKDAPLRKYQTAERRIERLKARRRALRRAEAAKAAKAAAAKKKLTPKQRLSIAKTAREVREASK